jgi:ABC-type glycerol-3-phosphate transport system substrate-binding protein
MALSRRAFLGHTAAGAATVAAIPALAACGAANQAGSGASTAVKFGDPVSITFWHTQTGTNAEALKEMVTKFNSTNGKNITLKDEYQGNYTQVFQKIQAAIQAGSPPDVAVAYESMVAEYMKAQAVIDLADYALKGPQAYTKESLDDIFPAYIDANKYDAFNGKLLSFPFTKSVAVQYLNEDLLKAAGFTKFAGQTFDDYKKMVQVATKKDGGKTTQYGYCASTDTSYIDAFTYANGGELLTKDKTKVAFNQQPLIDVFEMWGQMFKDGQAYTVTDNSYQNDFGAQKVAAYDQSSTGRPFQRPLIVDEATKKERFTWGIYMIPNKDASKPQTVMFGGNITVFKTNPLKQAASWEWIKFFTDKDQTVQWAIKSSYMPLRKSSAESAAMKQYWDTDPQGKQAFDLSKFAKPEPNITAWQDIRDLLTAAMVSVTTGKMTAKAALDDAATKANKLIDEKR